MKKRTLLLFLALALCLSLVPAAGAAEADCNRTDGVWAAIEALERRELPARFAAADCERLLPQVEALVTAREDYMPGSAEYRDGAFLWRAADGTACGYDPALRATIVNAVPVPETERIAAEREAERAAGLTGTTGDVTLMSGNSDSKDVAVFIPWWGKDTNFKLDLYYTGVRLANAAGGVCRRYLGEEATVDTIADALTSCCIVIIHTHGAPGKITVCSEEGITAGDPAYSSGAGVWSVDGQCICNHLRGPVTAEFVSLNACACMGSEGLEKPLREAGVDLVFGWSQTITFAADRHFLPFFADGLLQGMTAAEASVYAKKQLCRYVLDYNLVSNANVIAMLERTGLWLWDTWNNQSAVTAEEAKANGAPFPLFVSEQDPYPGEEHKDEVQTVKSTWKLPLGMSAQTNIRAWGTVEHYFAAFFPDAPEKITLLSGSLPPGIRISSGNYTGHYVDAACLYGIPTAPGYYEAQLKVELEGGKTETRTARIVIAREGIAKTEQKLMLNPGAEQTAFFTDGHTGELFTVETLSGRAPPGMTFLSDGGNLRYIGTPMEMGTFTAVYRIVLTSGDVIEHTVAATVPARDGVSSENLSLFVDAESKTFLSFEGADLVNYMQLVNGELPPGVTLQYSMSEAPSYSGTPEAAGTYAAAFRVTLLNGSTVTHLVTATVRSEAPFLDDYPMDLSLGETCIPKEDVDTWLFRSFICAARAGQIRLDSNRGRFDLDKDGSWDIQTATKPDGSSVFYLMSDSSLTGDDYTLTLNADAVADAQDQWEADHSKKYAKKITFHLSSGFDLYIAGTRVTSRNRTDILGNRVFSFNGVDTLFIHGNYSYNTGAEPLIRNEMEGMTLTVRTDEDSTLSCWGNCIETRGTPSNGGQLSLTGTGQLTLRSETGSGIVCEGAVLNVYNTSLMIQANQGKGITGTEGVVHARLSRANLALRTREGAMDGFWSIGMYGCTVSNPVRGVVGVIGGRNCLVDENKALLTNAQITAYDTKYGLTIDGIPVTDRNRNNVLGDGTFSFDGDHTLIVSKSYEGVNTKVPVIESSIDGLVIQAAPDTVLGSGHITCVSLGGTTTLVGGPLTVSSENRFGQGLSLEADADLLVSDMTLTVRGRRYGIQGSDDSGKLVISGAYVTAACTDSSAVAAIRVPGGISLHDCELVSPAGGAIKDGTVVTAEEAAAAEAVIAPVKISVSGSAMTYSVYLPGGGEPAALIAAWYDETGRMLGCAMETVTRDGMKNGTIQVEEDRKVYRLFAVSGETAAPLIPALTLTE